jgi:para-nitrobenzyl esterase
MRHLSLLLTLLSCVAGAALVAGSAQTNIQAKPRVQTTLGFVEGRLDGEVYAFTGIPYAEAPVGTRRFRAPEPKRPWTSVFDATRPGPLCPQVRMSGAVAGSEDCLTVNVWSPPNAKGLTRRGGRLSRTSAGGRPEGRSSCGLQRARRR